MSSLPSLVSPITGTLAPPPLRLLPTFKSTSVILKTTSATALFLSATAAAAFFSKPSMAIACPVPTTEQTTENFTSPETTDPLARILDSNTGTLDSLRTLLYKKLEDGDDDTALNILNNLISAHPTNPEWKFLAARLLKDMGQPDASRTLFEQILTDNPLSFEALFENAVLMDQSGEGEKAIERLQKALDIAEDEGKEKEVRDVRLIMAQIMFLQKDVDGAIACYEKLEEEDVKDYRPVFCQGVIYSLMERNEEAREKFKRYHELVPKKFEVDAYEQTGISRTRLFGTEDEKL